MTYPELITVMYAYRTGQLSRRRMELAIGLWQRKEHPFRWPVIDGVVTA